MATPDFYELLSNLTTANQIQDLLRKYKKEFPKEILVSGTKADVLEHLKAAVNAGRIPTGAVRDLLRECEENGDQHIFYFKAKKPEIAEKCRNGRAIAKSLWGTKWEQTTGFPKYDLIPRAYEWADFRLQSDEAEWVAKIYGQELTYRFTREETLSDGTLAKYYKEDAERVVCLARWNSPDILEMRIARCDSKQTLIFRLNKLWTMLRPALNEGEFFPWDLKKARKRMVKDRKQNEAIYHTGSLQLQDRKSGWAAFHPHTEEESTDDTDERTAAIDAYVEAGCGCDHLVARWQPVDGVLAGELITFIGAKFPHEIVIAAQTTSKAVDYVTDQLRHFGK